MSEADLADWEIVGTFEDLAEGEVLQSMIGEEEIVLCRAGKDVFALHNWCTHADARLSEGRLEGHELECPLHEGRFDIRNGKALCAPLDEDVRTFPIRVVGNEIYAKTK